MSELRLVIIFDEIDEKNIKKSDILLIQDYNIFLKYQNSNQVYLVDFTTSYESIELMNSIKYYFSQCNDEIKDISNDLYLRIFCPMYSIIEQIETIIKKENITQILITDGSNHIFCSSRYSEGEGIKKYYRTSWFLNSVIYSYFKDELKISWINKKTTVQFVLFNLIRESFLFVKSIILKIFKTLIYRENNKYLKFDKCIISIVNLDIQEKHIQHLLREIKSVPIIYIHPARKKMIEKSKNNVYHINKQVISLNSLLKNVINVFKIVRYSTLKDGIYIFKKYIKIDKRIMIICLRQIYFFYLIEKCELKNTISQIDCKKKLLITDMTFGLDIVSTHCVAKDLKIEHYNYQYVAMFPMLFPNFNLADKYYLYSMETFNLYKKFSDIFELYMPLNITNKLYYSKNNSITIFTQPDKYTDRYLKLINDMMDYSSEFLENYSVNIKLHYRQDRIEEFHNIIKKNKKFNIIDNNLEVQEIIENSDFIISMTSSVIFEATMNGVLSIIYNFNHENDCLIYRGGNLFPNINIVVNSIDELNHILKNITEYKLKFNKNFNENFDNILNVSSDYYLSIIDFFN